MFDPIEWLYKRTHKFRPHPESHHKLCAFCGKEINDLAGNPSLWGTWVPSRPHNENEFYHGVCVRDRLDSLDKDEIEKEVQRRLREKVGFVLEDVKELWRLALEDPKLFAEDKNWKDQRLD